MAETGTTRRAGLSGHATARILPEVMSIVKALTIAGSDSGGGAGIQADLKTFSAFRVFGMSVVTAVTAQNSLGVQGVFNLPPEFVARQIDSVLSDFGADAIKIGMLSTAPIIEAVAARLPAHRHGPVVLDPVMIAKSGDPLLEPAARSALMKAMLPLADLVTPILPDKMSFMEHLGELRVRIVRSLVALLVGLAIALPLSQRLTDYLAKPIQATGNTLVFLAVTEAFWVQMKVAVIAGLFIASPGILWQVWRFVSPGLYQHEKKYAMPFVIVGSLLFITGGAFSLFVVTPYAIQFLLSYARPGLQPMISVGSYIDFLLKFTLAFGLVFELPLAITLAARMGVVTPKVLAKNRKYAILGAFIAGAVLTPTPDAFNQTLMAGPLILLYEVGIICARIFGRKPKPVPVAEETPA